MNTYKNPAGYHTPQQSEQVLNTLRKEFPTLSFVDTSWHNDAADSFEIEDYTVTLPDFEGKPVKVNRFRVWMNNPEDDIPHYSICEQNTNQKEEDTYTDYNTVEELIEGLKRVIRA